ncbi:hypothetical protein ACJ3XI_00320 [Litorimonas sp. RW-G-Af-16]|uniref:hypothetical protein n=1 Tax=Litorimonas sp. RW-G-Af-16 TaxID=3241168 RepID=UPI00390C78EE
MSSPLKLSRNELLSLLKSAFQGLYKHDQDFSAMAETVLWLEMHGFGGVELLIGALGSDYDLPTCPAKLERTQAGYIFEGGGVSAIICAHNIADLMSTMVVQNTDAVMQIRGVTEPEALAVLPELCERQGVRIYPHHLPSHAHLLQPLSKASRQTFNDNLQNGIAIRRDHYDILSSIAARILVESTEQSRRGAGE